MIIASASSSLEPTTVTPDPSQSQPQLPLSFPDWKDEFLALFQGDFDNYRQVVEDRDNGLLPREGGGHEHMHSRLVPIWVDDADNGSDDDRSNNSSSLSLSSYSRLAAFYLDGVPANIFRFRYYRLSCRVPDALDLQIYFLDQKLEQRLRTCPVDDWGKTFADAAAAAAAAVRTSRNSTGGGGDDDDATTAATTTPQHVTYVPSCDIRWRRSNDNNDDDPVKKHFGTMNNGSGGHQNTGVVYHATMLAGDQGVVVPSQIYPHQLIHIQDEIWLTPTQLVIHDRGRDPDTGAWIYGNQRGVPYRLDRIITVKDNDDDKNNGSTPHNNHDDNDYDDSLQWTTIGPSSPLYADKMARIGGPSAPTRPRPPPPQAQQNNNNNDAGSMKGDTK